MSPCHYHPIEGYLLREHRADCRDVACEGCAPCTHPHHCTARERCSGHVQPDQLTCPRCVGRVRGDLAAIVTLHGQMLGEAIVQGVDSEAANLAGPATDPIRALWHRVDQARAGVALDPEDPHHPLAVLGRWEMMLREDYGQDYADLPRITIAAAAKYLDAMLDTIAQDPGQDFPLLAGEIWACRSHLEDVLHDSRNPERGAPCPACREDEGERPPRLVKRYTSHDTSGASDTWECPRCATWWSEADYRLRVADDYAANADWLTADQMRTQYGISVGSLTGWATKRLIDKRRSQDHQGRTLYRVDQARRLAGLADA